MKKTKYVSCDDVISALVEKGQSSERYAWGEEWELNFNEILDVLSAIPAADVMKISHAKDIYSSAKGHCEFKCSLCLEEIAEHWGGRFNYCPYCGAKLEE